MQLTTNPTGNPLEDSGAYIPSRKRIDRLTALFRRRHLAKKEASTRHEPGSAEARCQMSRRVTRKPIR